MKLYEVEITYQMYVQAESRQEAERIARSNMCEEEPEVHASEVSGRHSLSADVRRSWPWGGDCEKTVGDLVDEMKQAPTPSVPPPVKETP